MHGSLLALSQLMKHPAALKNTQTSHKLTHALADSLKELMRSRFLNFAKCVTSHGKLASLMMTSKKDNNATHVRLAVLSLIPELAAFDTTHMLKHKSNFEKFCLMDSITFLLSCIKNSQSQDKAFISLGNLCSKLGHSITRNPLFNEIINAIRESFMVINVGDLKTESSAALQALGMIVKVTTSNPVLDGKIQERDSKFASELVIPLVDSMFKCGLSHVLIDTLKIISENVDTARGTIQSRLFGEIDKVSEHLEVCWVPAEESFSRKPLTQRTKTQTGHRSCARIPEWIRTRCTEQTHRLQGGLLSIATRDRTVAASSASPWSC